MCKILVIDDIPDSLHTTKGILTDAGYMVKSFNNPQQALDAIEKESFDLAIVDVRLFGHKETDDSGLLLARAIKRANRAVCIIFVTGYVVSSQWVINALNAGEAFACIEKGPNFHKELLDAVDQALAQLSSRYITWLHLSDLHFHRPDYESDIVLGNLIRDIDAQMKEPENLRPDFIVLTGDIAYSSTKREYTAATSFFDNLLRVTELPRERLFVVPGNHDVNWGIVSKDEPVASGYRTTLITKDQIDKTLSSSAQLRRILKKFRYYRRFVNDYFPFRPFDEKSFFFVETIECANKRVSILGLNSAWMSAYNWKPGKEGREADDRHNLLLGRKQLRDALQKTEAESSDLIIVMMHHPTEWLKDEIDRQEVEALLAQKSHFVLRGHLHDQQIVSQKTPGGDSYIITAGASFQKRGNTLDYNGYNFVRLNLVTGQVTIYLRCYSNKYGGFWTKDVYSYPNMADGRYSFSLPQSLLV